MTGVRQEASGVGQHTDEVAEASKVCKAGHLVGHTYLVIVEPPSRTVLELACCGGILEASDDRADYSVIVRVQGVQDGSRDLVGCAQCVQEVSGLSCRSVVVDAVVSGIRSELFVHVSVVVALATVVDLHSPVILVILLCKEHHECSLVLEHLLLGNFLAGQLLCDDCIDLSVGCRNVNDEVQTVVGYAASHGSEELHTIVDCAL